MSLCLDYFCVLNCFSRWILSLIKMILFQFENGNCLGMHDLLVPQTQACCAFALAEQGFQSHHPIIRWA